MPDFIVNPAAGNAAALDLRNLIDVEELQRIQDDFATSTGLAMITVDSMGRPVTEASRFSTLCQYLRRDPAIRAKCYSCDAYGGLQSAIEGRPVVYPVRCRRRPGRPRHELHSRSVVPLLRQRPGGHR